MGKIKRFIKKVLPTWARDRVIEYLSARSQKSYSQTGEDLLLKYLLRYQGLDRKDGFYIDVGALHPDIISNTKLLYKKGWHGINIDALPGSMNKFNKRRPRDINIEAVVANSDEEQVFFIFEDKALNTLSNETANYWINNGKKLENTIKIKPKKLKDILDEYDDKIKKIDLMSIDVEGIDLQVLKSNNWDKYRPHFILIECAEFDLDKPNEFEIYRYLKELNYKLTSKINVNLLFEDTKL